MTPKQLSTKHDIPISEVCRITGRCHSTLYDWCYRYPGLAEAIFRGCAGMAGYVNTSSQKNS